MVLPQLACELVRQRGAASTAGIPRTPIAVILERHGEEPNQVLDAVDDEARACGVHPGQAAAEATALVSRLAVHRVAIGEIDSALGRVAEIALVFGTTAAIALDEERSIDTVWLDVTGSAHLVGGEEALLDLLVERVRALGHRVRLAIADGPRIAQAVARWAPPNGKGHLVVPGEGKRALEPLPIYALPIERDIASFLVRVGVMTIGDLVRLPREAAHARLGRHATLALDLALGRDDGPLVAYLPPRVLVEDISFEEGVTNTEALLFVARGMIARLAIRLGARGEASSRLEATISYDRSIAALRAQNSDAMQEASLSLSIDLPAPLSAEGDLFRAMKAKLERTPLLAPAVAFRVSIPQIARARRVQLDLSRDAAVSPDALPTLLAELSAEIGADRIGVFEVVAAHRPEARSRLVSADLLGGVEPQVSETSADAMPTRLLPQTVPLGRVRRGAVVAIDQRLYTLEDAKFVMRLDGVEWWLGPVSNAGAPRHRGRDYLRARLTSPSACADALVYVDRQSGEMFLHGWYE